MKIPVAKFRSKEDVQIPGRGLNKGLSTRRTADELAADHAMHFDTEIGCLVITHASPTTPDVYVPADNLMFFEVDAPAPEAEEPVAPAEPPPVPAFMKPAAKPQKAGKVTVGEDE